MRLSALHGALRGVAERRMEFAVLRHQSCFLFFLEFSGVFGYFSGYDFGSDKMGSWLEFAAGEELGVSTHSGFGCGAEVGGVRFVSCGF